MRAIPPRWYVAAQTGLSVLAVVGGLMAIAALGDGRWLSAVIFLASLALVVLTSTRAQQHRPVHVGWPVAAVVLLVIGLAVMGIEPKRPTPWPFIATMLNDLLRLLRR